MLQNSRGMFFLREPKRRMQLRHRRKGLLDPEAGNKINFQKCKLFKLTNQNSEIGIGTVSA